MSTRRFLLELLINARNNTEDALGGASSGLGKLFTLIAGSGAVFAAMRFADMAMDLAEVGAQADRLYTSFENLAGTTAPLMLEKLRTASRGTISDMSLLQSANRAMMLGVTKDTDTMVKLLEVAMARGAAMGLSARQAFNDLMTGIGRASPLILDNLGIVTGGQKVYDDYAASIGKTAKELDDLEKRQALVNLVLQNTTPLVEDNLMIHERARAATENLKVEIGLYLAELTRIPDVLADVAQRTADVISATRSAVIVMQPYNDVLSRQARILDEMEFQRRIVGLRTIESLLAKKMMTEEGAIAASEELLGLQEGWNVVVEESSALLRQWTKDREYHTDTIWDQLRALKALAQTTEAQQAIYATMEEEYRLNSARRRGDLQGEARILQARLVNLEAFSEDWLKIHFQLRTILDQSEIQADREEKRRVKEHNREMQRLQQEHMSEMRSALETALAPTQITELDMAATRLGIYVDKIDEFVRRVRAGAQDAGSEWRRLIPQDVLAQGADAVALYVDKVERLFYGLRWDELAEFTGGAFDPAEARERWLQRAVEEIQAMRHYKATIEAMIPELSRRVGGLTAEEQAIVAADPKTQAQITGAAWGEGASIGVSSVDYGAILIKTITTQVKDRKEEITSIGFLIGQNMLLGMQDSITPGALDDLIDVFGPAFVSWLMKKGYLGGD